jgi:hypothetical protein
MKIRCKTFDPERHELSSFRYAQAKLDGIWLEVRGGPIMLSSQDTNLTLQCQDLECFGEVPMGHSVYGELYAPGLPASEVKSRLARGGELKFAAFATSLLSAHADLFETYTTLHQLGWQVAPHLTLDGAKSIDIVLAVMHSMVYDTEIEGLVLKDGNFLNWYKWKPVKTIDLVVTGFEDGRGKYVGLVGSLQGSLTDGREVADVGGFDDATRIALSDEIPLGRVMEVAYQYVGAGGRLRHPRFVRWRDDKKPEECTADQDPELLHYV